MSVWYEDYSSVTSSLRINKSYTFWNENVKVQKAKEIAVKYLQSMNSRKVHCVSI